MPALVDYINETRRLLKDSDARYWTDEKLIKYINEARKFIAAITSCCRYSYATEEIRPENITAESFASQYVEKFERPLPQFSLDQGGKTVSTFFLAGISILYGSRYNSLFYLPRSEFLKYVQINQRQIPRIFTIYGNMYAIYPLPNIVYPAIFDCIVEPYNLTDYSEQDIIIYPYNTIVSLYAAHLAENENSPELKTVFLNEFELRLARITGKRHVIRNING